ncbi:reverse transcriptase domain-containing protein [Trichonephila inaurata madagascariensis]|uniref:Reverse transcriptase domain-containing protein n=1 Tax=Trichonephila inaurata madagascariensis TaxID=2747483 RepID=A0A8X6JFN0_9ARAC|nr:reverse transcriptase domain-containing protein [Trichonephila inaurata madagascariensis]
MEEYRETFEMLNTSLYVDDLFAGSSESVNKAFDLSKSAIEILRYANMNLRKFKTNSEEFRKLWNENGIGDGLDWDEELPTELKEKWKTQFCILNDLTLEKNIFHILFGVQITAPLPAVRVEQSAPFSVVGIDFGGPLYTKDEKKPYIVFFMCAVTRALPLRASEQSYN